MADDVIEGEEGDAPVISERVQVTHILTQQNIISGSVIADSWRIELGLNILGHSK